MQRRHFYLVGFMGAGKSTIGARVAQRSGRPFVDLDELIAARAGVSVAAIFTSQGESAFRAEEQAALAALGAQPASVVATGAGLVLAAANRRELRRSGFSVWLDVPLAEARRRVLEGASRPLWNEPNSLEFRAFFEKRRAHYAFADARVDAAAHPLAITENHVFRCFERFFH